MFSIRTKYSHTPSEVLSFTAIGKKSLIYSINPQNHPYQFEGNQKYQCPGNMKSWKAEQ